MANQPLPTDQVQDVAVVPPRRRAPAVPNGKMAQVNIDPNEFDFESEGSSPTAAKPAATPPANAVSPAATPPAKPQAPPAPKHSERVYRLADLVGISRDEADRLDHDSLMREIDLAEREAQIAHRRESQQRAAAQARAAAQPAPQPPTETPIDWGVGEDGRQLTEADYAPPIRNMIKASHKSAQEVEKLKGELDRERMANRANAEAEMLEGRFAERPDLFGKGRAPAIKKPSQEWSRRIAMYHLVKNAPESMGDFHARYDWAFGSMFGGIAPPAPTPAGGSAPDPYAEEAAAAARNGHNPRFTEEQFADAALARPTERQVAPPAKGVQRAKQTFANKLKDAGFVDDFDVSMPEEESELPD